MTPAADRDAGQPRGPGGRDGVQWRAQDVTVTAAGTGETAKGYPGQKHGEWRSTSPWFSTRTPCPAPQRRPAAPRRPSPRWRRARGGHEHEREGRRNLRGVAGSRRLLRAGHQQGGRGEGRRRGRP
ncbi:hypothetical protein QJS66_08210 [Kocuria rhizophila]|nr:hypothetical protein QJS66_08210 [Kocuria rhizophila]